MKMQDPAMSCLRFVTRFLHLLQPGRITVGHHLPTSFPPEHSVRSSGEKKTSRLESPGGPEQEETDGDQDSAGVGTAERPHPDPDQAAGAATYYSSNKSKGLPLAHGRSDQIRLSDLIGCPIQPYGAADVSVSGDMSADTRCHPHPILSVKSGRMETLFSIRPGWGSDRMGSDESGQAVRSQPIPHREQRGSDISLSAHSAETELSSAGSAGISGSIPAEQRTVRNVFVCH
ncbi:hypothetical protein NDU88_003418 [Pleurodeles waltl]|uniref:Uncharacterized protein n=1 Tax=Pleurodeles waltl TaxID=8319 RepID=A0AAV7LN12_PLEWA|nr:hypothetical protein NDU88_003418 [Pleurodeles waltl]